MVASWHVPRLETYNQPPPAEVLHVCFLEKLPKVTEEGITESLRQVDLEWARQYDPHVRPRELLPMPWIRDHWPPSEAIVEMASANKSSDGQEYKSMILVDSGWEAGAVIAARWTTGHGDEPYLSAARVPMSIANLLLTLCDNGRFTSLAAALGEEEYEDVKVDFYKDRKPPKPVDTLPFRPPSFLPKDLSLSRSKLQVLSLLPLDHDLFTTLEHRISGGSLSDVQLHNWEGEPLTRPELVPLFGWIEGNTPEGDRTGYVFLVDSVLQDEDGLPQVIAVSRTAHYGNPTTADTISLLPVHVDKVVDIWKASNDTQGRDEPRDRKNGIASHEEQLEYGDVWRRERMVALDQPIQFDEIDSCCAVVFLQDFERQEERQIRRGLAELWDIEEGEDWGKEFLYLGYLWAQGSGKKTVQDLRDLFQRCDPFSPFFDPEHAPFRLTSYPHHFVCVDERSLDMSNPRVTLVSSRDVYHPTNDLGWTYGTVPPAHAYLNWVNLDIANMGPVEIYDDGKAEKLWLGDLTSWVEEHGDEEDWD